MREELKDRIQVARIKLRLPQFREHTDSSLHETLIDFLQKKGSIKEDSVEAEDQLRTEAEEFVVANTEQDLEQTTPKTAPEIKIHDGETEYRLP